MLLKRHWLCSRPFSESYSQRTKTAWWALAASLLGECRLCLGQVTLMGHGGYLAHHFAGILTSWWPNPHVILCFQHIKRLTRAHLMRCGHH